MTKSEIQYKIQDLKAEYVRLQNDLEKLEYVQGNTAPLYKQLDEIEAELRTLNKELDELK
ncbi:hypothetical protein CU633_10665 [Bacillus sp. V3-13]|uniref:SE1832 family protein n=1 Tax=Bacillus sp. V3-13 TaxID=2053728 RepID=UPI000C760B98|nr:SE1832 family protein [Bacillus sp. V3-13]PLR77407.1 hypothetical protein CU633_10665 [Bacillus sp. V3-13]